MLGPISASPYESKDDNKVSSDLSDSPLIIPIIRSRNIEEIERLLLPLWTVELR